MAQKDTICAIATPPGAGGIGVVRISGPEAFSVLQRLWLGRKKVSDFEPRRLYLGEILGEKREVIDRVMAVFMKAPNTYTGEDVVEFSAHGSQVVLQSLLKACVASGARLAGPGEFTRRAFMAGKLDLAQAEGVADLINATSERAARLAKDQLGGKLSKEVLLIGEMLADLRAEVEAGIDFSEEEGVGLSREEIILRLKPIVSRLQTLSQTFRDGRQIREGARVAIIGKPNVGKSSLLNRLAGHDRALVHHAPGTTRDVIEEIVTFEGMTFRFRDTAGLRDGSSEVESLGIDRTQKEIEAADFVIAVFDGSSEFTLENEVILEKLSPTKTLIVINKQDLPQKIPEGVFKRWQQNTRPIKISAKANEGVSGVIARLVSEFVGNKEMMDGALITNERHKSLIDDAFRFLESSQKALVRGDPVECVAGELCGAQDSLGNITGAVTTEELLDLIFSKFCIGK